LEKTELSILLYFNSPFADMHPGVSAGINRLLNETLFLSDKISLNYYFSGFRLEELFNTSREAMKKLSEAIHREKAELLAGGFYEPDFSDIPKDRKKEQLNIAMEFYKSSFSYSPKTLFVPHLLWDEDLLGLASDQDMHSIVRLGVDCSLDENICQQGLPIIDADMILGKKLFSKSEDAEIKPYSIAPFPGDILSNEAGTNWFIGFLEEISKKYSIKLIRDLKKPSKEGEITTLDYREKLIHDIFINFPFYAFFESDFPNNVSLDNESINKDYFRLFPEQRRLSDRLYDIYKGSVNIHEKALAKMEFYSFTSTWPGISSSLNYNFLRHRFVRDCIFIKKDMKGVSKGRVSSNNDIELKSEPYFIKYDKKEGFIKVLDFIESGYSMSSINYSKKELLKLRGAFFGDLPLPEDIYEESDPGIFRDKLFLSKNGKNSLIHAVKTETESLNNGDISSIITKKEYKDEKHFLNFEKKISFRRSNNYIFVKYMLENKADIMVTYLIRTGTSIGLSYPHTPGNEIQYICPDGAFSTGLEKELVNRIVHEVNVKDLLLGINIFLNLDMESTISLSPIYFYDRLPKQFQKMFQGVRLNNTKSVELSPGEKKEIEFNLRIKKI